MAFARSGKTATWSPDGPLGSILALAEGAGLTMPSGCRVGQCESCLVPIRQGQVRHLVDRPDLEDGQCLTCQALPLTDLVLDA
ncbi:2Fe-2S iron-sulfur cluster-binding protein [Bosea psychrotolerans]|nr:2Fe-2S iron-sulfur cluster binding domain-containing protein [Bosea psychrotolerans]